MRDLPPDLQRIFNVGAKVYNTSTSSQGKVSSVVEDSIFVDYGNKAKSNITEYTKDDFSELLLQDQIVAASRLTIGTGDKFKIKPRLGQLELSTKPAKWTGSAPNVQSLPRPGQPNLEVGYINEKTGKFSKEYKKGYIKIEYKKATQKVVLELDDDQLTKLKELGLV